MPRLPRRQPDGSPDIGHYRRKARRLRRLARRRLSRALARWLAAAIRAPGGWSWPVAGRADRA